jgi:hypothetical protein
VAESGAHGGYFDRAPSDVRWPARRDPATSPDDDADRPELEYSEADDSDLQDEDDAWYDDHDDARYDSEDGDSDDHGDSDAHDPDAHDPDGDDDRVDDARHGAEDPDARDTSAGAEPSRDNGSSDGAAYWTGPRQQQVYTSIGDVVQPDPPDSWRRRSEAQAASPQQQPTVSQRRTVGPQGVDRRSRWSGASGAASEDAGGGTGEGVGRPVVPEWARPPAEVERPEPETSAGRGRVWDLLITAVIVLIVVATIVTAGMLVLR